MSSCLHVQKITHWRIRFTKIFYCRVTFIGIPPASIKGIQIGWSYGVSSHTARFWLFPWGAAPPTSIMMGVLSHPPVPPMLGFLFRLESMLELSIKIEMVVSMLSYTVVLASQRLPGEIIGICLEKKCLWQNLWVLLCFTTNGVSACLYFRFHKPFIHLFLPFRTPPLHYLVLTRYNLFTPRFSIGHQCDQLLFLLLKHNVHIFLLSQVLYFYPQLWFWGLVQSTLKTPSNIFLARA